MSVLDDVLFNADSADFDGVEEAREELELLRDAAFDDCASELVSGQSCGCCGGMFEGETRISLHRTDCTVARILRTDPERAKAMGLGWAL